MKSLSKIIPLLLIGVGVVTIFYPVKVKPDIKGSWNVDKLMVKQNEIPFNGSVNIDENRFDISVNNLFEFKYNDSNKYTYTIVGDSIYLESDKTQTFTGNYKFNNVSKVIGGGENAYYNITLNLVSKNKSISMFRTEKLHWQKGIPRGTP